MIYQSNKIKEKIHNKYDYKKIPNYFKLSCTTTTTTTTTTIITNTTIIIIIVIIVIKYIWIGILRNC